MNHLPSRYLSIIQGPDGDWKPAVFHLRQKATFSDYQSKMSARGEAMRVADVLSLRFIEPEDLQKD